MVVVGFSSNTTNFSATFCQRAENFQIKIGFLKLDSQSPWALINNLASSSVNVDLRSKVSATAEEEGQPLHHDRHHFKHRHHKDIASMAQRSTA